MREKNKNIVSIIIIILLVIIISLLSIFIYKNRDILGISNVTTNPVIQVSSDRYVMLKYTVENSLSVTELLVFDSDFVCKNTRVMQEALNDEFKEYLKKTYDAMSGGIELAREGGVQVVSNAKLEYNVLKFNISQWNGYTKDEILEGTASMADGNKVEIIYL